MGPISRARNPALVKLLAGGLPPNCAEGLGRIRRIVTGRVKTALPWAPGGPGPPKKSPGEKRGKKGPPPPASPAPPPLEKIGAGDLVFR